MKLTRDNFPALLTPIHKKIFFDAYAALEDEYTQICDVENMEEKQQSYPHMGAFGLWDENNEGNTINEDEMSEGDTASFEARRFDKGYELTWELIKDDLYNVMKGLGKGGSAKGLGTGLKATIETDFAAVLNGGFSNTGYDAVPLFSNSHPLADSASLLDNLHTGALTDTTYKTGAILMKGQVDEANIKIRTKVRQLIVPDELEYTGKAILDSSGPAGELSNDINTAPIARLIVMSYLTSATAWFLRDSNFENFKFLWREKPIYDWQPIQKTIDIFCYGYARWDCGYVDIRGLVGSAG